MRNFFVSIYRFFDKKPWLLWSILILLIGFSVWGMTRLRFVEDISSFLPQNSNNQRVNYAYQHIGASNKIVLNFKKNNTSNDIENEDYTILTNAVDSVVAQLQQSDSSHFIKNLLYEVNQEQVNEITDFVVQNMPYFLTEEDYERMDTLLSKENIAQQIENDKFLLASPMGVMQNIIISDPLFFSSNILKSLTTFQLSDQYHQENGYLFNKKGDEAIVVVTSQFPISETDNNAKLIAQIENAISTVEKSFNQEVKISAFGASMVSLTNSNQIKKDSILAIVISLILILALLIYYYRNFKSILLIAISIAFGGIFALGFIVLFKNPISIIAVGVASIILGIAVNYPIHFLSHFKHTNNKEQIIKDIVTPLLIGNITTVGAFLSLIFISSDAMHDLGLFAALLLVGTIVFVLIFLPHFLGKKKTDSKTYTLSFGRIAKLSPENNKWFIILILLLTCVFFAFSFRTSFETNMHEINYMTEEQRDYFDKLSTESDTTMQTLYCVSEGATTEGALRNYELIIPEITDLMADSAIKKCAGIGNFLPSAKMQKQRLARWNQFWNGRDTQFLADVDAAASKSGFSTEAFEPLKKIIQKNYQPQSMDYFQPIMQNLADNYVTIENDKTMIYNILSVDKSKKQYVEQRLNSQNENVFAFTDSSIISRMVEALSGDFNYVLYICGLIVFAFLLFSFGRLEIALMSFIPLTVAWIWILGLMGIFDMRFNIVNIILATFIFGQGDDYTIFVTEGLIYEYRTGKKMLAQFKNSIILSSLIMFVGIGTLIFAKHPAMRSLAEVTVIGMFSVVMMAYFFPPLIFKWLVYQKGKKRLRPITLWNLVKTVLSFLIFLICAFPMTILACILNIFAHNNEKMRYKFHVTICATFRNFAKMMMQVPFKIINLHNENFENPAVIICNHQSYLDLLYTLLLSPKIIVLTNMWNWNTPFYRRIIRYAEFLPVADGIESNIHKIKKMVERGYSVLIFPEGTRSVDCKIARFHQGAFYLAKELNLDVLPVVLHGIGHIFPKTEFLTRKGSITIKVLPRIQPENEQYRKDKELLQTARSFRKLMQDEYQNMVDQYETPAYYKDLVLHNYIYKGKEIEKNARKILKKNTVNEEFINSLPMEGHILITHCGCGEVVLLAALVKNKLQITATDDNEEALTIAQNCTSVPSNLHYVHQIDSQIKFDMTINMKNQYK